MIDGLAQQLNPGTKRLFTGKFEDFSFNISNLVRTNEIRSTHLTFINSFDMLHAPQEVRELTGATAGELAEELHSRLSRTVFCVVAALVGFATLLASGFSRFGVWREIIVALLLLLALDGMIGAASGPVIANASLWPLFYVPNVLGICLTIALLWWSAHPGWWRRRRTA
jgi:lipopolysaccharide export system permease protein